MTLKHLRSSTADKRPQASGMADGQLAINTASGSPGLFFKDTNGSIVKIGPVHVGSGAPNASPASGGTTGNSLGEQWLDTSNGNYVFKIWDGGAWRSETGEFVNASGDTMTGSLVLGSGASLVFEGSTDDGFETTLTVVDPTADRTITLPNVNGTVVTTGDTGTVTSTMLLDGTIVNADVNASAAIAGTKISPDFGSQNLTTTGTSTAASFTPTSSTVPTNGVYLPAANNVAISTGGAGRLFVDASGNVAIGAYSFVKPLTIATTNAAIALRANSSGTYTDQGIFFAVDGTNYSQIYNDGIGQLIFRTGSGLGERLRITSAGNVGIGTASPTQLLDVVGNADASVGSRIRNDSTGSSAQSVLSFSAAGRDVSYVVNYSGQFASETGSNIVNKFTNFDTHIWRSNAGSERARIDSVGRFLIGTSTAVSSSTGVQGFLQHQSSDTGTAANANFGRWTNDTGGYALYFAKSRGTSVGTQGLVSNGDFLGALFFEGSDGTQLRRAASITANVDGTPGSSDMPGRLAFFTTADGASSPTERLRITSAGLVGIGTTSPASPLEVVGLVRSSGASGNTGFGAFSGSAELSVGTNGTSSYVFSNSNIPLVFSTFGAERARLDSSGRLLVGSSTARTNYFNSTGTAQLQIEGVGTAAATASITCDRSLTAAAATLALNKSAGDTVGSNTLVSSDDTLGVITFQGNDGTEFVQAASISAFTDGTPGANSMPGRIVLSTTASGASNPTERMRIDSNGGVGIGGTAGSSTTLRLVKNITGATSAFALNADGQIQSGVTSDASYFRTSANTVDAAFSLGSLIHYQAAQGTITGGSRTAPTNQYGFWVRSSLTGATNNYGFYSDIASGTGRFNFYANGTATNYFAGNVGIGTTSPSGELHIAGSDANTDIFITEGSTNTDARIRNSNGVLLLDADVNNENASSAIVLGVDGTERLRITSDGKVGLGTSVASAGLTVALGNNSIPAAGATGAAALFSNSVALNTYGLILGAATTGAGYIQAQRADGTATTYDLHLQPNGGRVGIGTSSPSAILHVVSADNATTGLISGATNAIRIVGNNTGVGGGAIEGVNAAASAFAPLLVGGSDLRLAISGTERARIDSSGRLLVGTSSSTNVNIATFQGNSSLSTGTGIVNIAFGNTSPGSTDQLGRLQFTDSGHNSAAEIIGQRDGGTWNTSTSRPTALVVRTTADGASSPTERMRIDSRGAVRTGNKILYTGTTGAVTATTGTTVFNFDFSGTTTRHTALVKLSVMHLVATNNIASQPAAEYIFAVEAYTTGVCAATSPTAIFQNVYVAATHFAFADVGSTSFKITLTNPSATAASAVYYKVEVLDNASALDLTSVTTT